MINFCGQDIQIGDFVGLGIRAGNGSEHRVGVVLRFVDVPVNKYEDPARVERKARCLWFDENRKETGYTFESVQRFPNLFLLDPATLKRRIRTCLQIAYNREAGSYR